MSVTKITNDNIEGMDASKLTGTIANARISASSVSQHATTYDDASIRSDILKLALHQAIDGNRVAYNLEDSFIDGFEDDAGITTETTVDRDTTGEYVGTSVPGSAVYETGDRRSTITVTDQLPGQAAGFFNDADGDPEHLVDGTITANTTYGVSLHGNATSGQYCRFQFTTAKVVTECKWYQGSSMSHGVWKWQASNDGTTFTDIGSSFTLGGSTAQIQTQLSGNVTSYTYYQLLGISGTVSGAHYVSEVEFKAMPLVIGATGTLISDPQTASTSRTSASGVIIYEDADGTNTLGTDLKVYFSCNNSAWTEASSYGTATTYSGTKKLVKLGATTCTAGTSVAMKAEWANQLATGAGSYVTGNRASTITVTSDLSVSGGTISTLVDGTISTGGGFYPSSAGFNPAGKYIRFQFSTAQTITAVKFHTQGAGEDLGVWKWQGSNDASSWTDVSAAAILAYDLTDITTFTNSTAYVYYRALGVSGAGDATWIYEAEFEHAGATGKEARLHGWAVNY